MDVKVFLDSLGISSLDVQLDRDAMSVIMRKIVSSTMTGFSCTGLENIAPEKACLFVSNHRDIFLDAALLQLALYEKGYPPTHILAGQNLMTHPLMIKVCEANQVFCIERGGNGRRAFYDNMLKTSARIREYVEGRNESVWIAQRNGRTKDGRDHTDPAVLKMLALTGEGTWQERIRALHIVPMSISYEWESCDVLKAKEMLARSQGPYTKAPNEDMVSIATGIMQPKGRCRLVIGKPIADEEVSTPEQLAQLLDSRIGEGYALWPNHYAALDLLNGSDEHAGCYTPEEKARFIHHIEAAGPELSLLLLHQYAGI